MNREEEYTPSGFTTRDFMRLYDMNVANQDTKDYVWYLNGVLASRRDKRVQRELRYRFPGGYTVLMCPFEEVPLHIGSNLPEKRLIAKWRLELVK